MKIKREKRVGAREIEERNKVKVEVEKKIFSVDACNPFFPSSITRNFESHLISDRMRIHVYVSGYMWKRVRAYKLGNRKYL